MGLVLKIYPMIRLILGDQLNPKHTWYSNVDPSITYAFFECMDEASYAPHHIQKVAGIFAAMRQFAANLSDKGHNVHYKKITASRPSLAENLIALTENLNITVVQCQEPDEWRVKEHLNELSNQGVTMSFVSSEHFISTTEGFKQQFSGKKSLLMESFYRRMRKETGILMEGQQPVGGKWNFDASNRKSLPKNHQVPPRFFPETDVTDVLKDIEAAGVKTIGSIGDPKYFYWPTNTDQAKSIFYYWLEHDLPYFGDFQDAMARNQWAMYHSRISFALNTKMIDPLWVCQQVELAYRNRPEVSISAAEGFIRQIIGWREFMRGAYWMRMPEFGTLNYFEHDRKLPEWFWTGETHMECMKQTIGQSLSHAYAHHIQRLMITGNFALLSGIDPSEVDLWYLGIYIDAFEWVEITNTRGMSQFADGGWIATKPYVSSANYIHKMSDYCGSCKYDRKTKTEANSCPFNTLYWDFYMRHSDKLGNNPRIGMVYRTLNKMTPEAKGEIQERASWILNNLNTL